MIHTRHKGKTKYWLGVLPLQFSGRYSLKIDTAPDWNVNKPRKNCLSGLAMSNLEKSKQMQR